MWGVPELIAECLNGQWRIPLSSIVDRHIDASAFAHSLSRQLHRLSSHVREFLHNLGIRLRSFLGGLIGHLQRR